MDYSKFNDDDFDARDWVNSAFKTHKDGTVEQHATTLVMKLQMFMQEVNNVIEDTCQQAVTNLPRVVKELEAVKQEAMLLQEQMKMVKYDIQKVEHDTAHSMQNLLKLDKVKERMKLASDALQEADNWTTLSSDVEEVFSSQDIDAITRKIIGMQQSLHILTDVPDYLERCQYLESLKNRLEATSSTQIVASFTSQSLELAQKFAKIFQEIDRMPQLCKYYHKCHKHTLQESWKEIHRKYGENLEESLKEFFDTLLNSWQAQVKWCKQVFPDAVSIASDLIKETLKDMNPPLSYHIEQFLKNSQKAPIDNLLNLKAITDKFVNSLETAIIFHHQESISVGCIESLLASIYFPFKSFIHKFGEYEQIYLSNFLDNLKLDHEDIMESVSLLEQSVTKVFQAVNESYERCMDFSNGCAILSFLDIIKEFFKNYLSEVKRVIRNICEKSKVDSSVLDNEEWSHFQNSLRVIQMCGDLILHAEELDQLLVTNIIELSAKFFQSSNINKESPLKIDAKKQTFKKFDIYLIRSDEDRKALVYFVNNLVQGDNQSVLEPVKKEMYELSELIHKFSFYTVFSPLKHYLSLVPNLQVWESDSTGSALTSNLPRFSLAPQEYITKVGQYLMTLPQQLESFTTESTLMMRMALKHGKLPYTGDIGEPPEHLADLWLESLARGSMHIYCEQILLIHELTTISNKQLLVDIDYLMNVLDDLGLKPSETITNISTLLKTPEENYQEIAENCPLRLSSAIANMRAINNK